MDALSKQKSKETDQTSPSSGVLTLPRKATNNKQHKYTPEEIAYMERDKIRIATYRQKLLDSMD